jgi:hypothetical protein
MPTTTSTVLSQGLATATTTNEKANEREKEKHLDRCDDKETAAKPFVLASPTIGKVDAKEQSNLATTPVATELPSLATQQPTASQTQPINNHNESESSAVPLLSPSPPIASSLPKCAPNNSVLALNESRGKKPV